MLLLYDSEERRKTIFPPIVGGKWTTGFDIIESEAGSDTACTSLRFSEKCFLG
jgi:alkylation response protein AidB-like acyl-CoA dehydrogenase